MSSNSDKSFKVPGITLHGPAAASSQGNVSDVQSAIYTDAAGNLRFRDDFITEVLGEESLSLRDFYVKSNGVFAKDGALFLSDDVVSRPYSLEEIVNACRKWRENLTTGSLWWLGRTAIDHSSCANLPRQNNPTGPNKVWSIDRFLASEFRLSACDSPDKLSVYNKLVNAETGKRRWFDVPGVEIVIPPIEDQYKASFIISKLAYGSYNQPEPVIFRLYDATADVELTRTAVVQACEEKIMNPTTLSYFGLLPTIDAEQCSAPENCGCTTLECIEGDQSCTTADTGTIIANRFKQGSRLIKVQFQVINYHEDHWERVFGTEINDEYLSTSTIDTVIFDVNPRDRFTKKQSTVDFRNEDTKIVTFEEDLGTSSYSISLSSERNINLWYSNKSSAGFTIKSELPFTGKVDWSIVNLNPSR